MLLNANIVSNAHRARSVLCLDYPPLTEIASQVITAAEALLVHLELRTLFNLVLSATSAQQHRQIKSRASEERILQREHNRHVWFVRQAPSALET